ncbi:unnamed protein product [Prorocentrum cordatum]|uniref:Phospholipase B-like n=1 Tax=Prorocentrum cordatum TaxID=2364126 RepID=A0ABN9QIF3_9DINO|nr:unnamed protein product [Polarella glacialis]
MATSRLPAPTAHSYNKRVSCTEARILGRRTPHAVDFSAPRTNREVSLRAPASHLSQANTDRKCDKYFDKEAPLRNNVAKQYNDASAGGHGGCAVRAAAWPHNCTADAHAPALLRHPWNSIQQACCAN